MASSHLRLSGLEDLTPSEQRELMWTLKGLYSHFYNLQKRWFSTTCLVILCHTAMCSAGRNFNDLLQFHVRSLILIINQWWGDWKNPQLKKKELKLLPNFQLFFITIITEANDITKFSFYTSNLFSVQELSFSFRPSSQAVLIFVS